MRARSGVNFSLADLPEIARRCRERGARAYLAFNAIMFEGEKELVEHTIDAAMPHVDADDEETRNKIYYMINPEITYTEGTQESSEGCLSVPGYMGLVDRPYKIRIRATDLEGEEHEYEFEGFEATVFCHEYDHLEGILYTDIAKDMMTVEEYSEILEEIKQEHEEDPDDDNGDIWEKKRERNGK